MMGSIQGTVASNFQEPLDGVIH